MTDLERALAAGGVKQESDLDRALKAGGVSADSGDEGDEAPPDWLTPGKAKKRPPGPYVEPLPKRLQRTYPQADFEGLRRMQEGIPTDTQLAIKSASGVGNSMINAATLGGYKGLLRLGGRAIPALDQAANDIEDYRADNPTISQFSDAPGYFVGPSRMLAEAVGAGLGAATRNAPAIVQRVANARPVAGALSGASGGGASAAVQTASEGGDLSDIARESGRAALIGGALGGGAGLVTTGLARAGRAIENSKGGQARRFIEEHGGTVRPGGVDLEGDYATMGTSDKDIGRQAGVSARKVLRDLAKEHKGARSAIGAQKNRIADEAAQSALDTEAVPEEITEGNETEQIPRQSMAETMGEARPREEVITRRPTEEEATRADRKLRPTVEIPVQSMEDMMGPGAPAEAEAPHTPSPHDLHDVSDVVSRMREVADGIGVHDAQRATLQNEIAAITKRQGAGFNPETDNYFLSESDVNELRAKLDRLGKVGTSTDVRLRPVQQAANDLRKITEAGPYGDVNRQFADEYKRYGRAREQLGLAPTTTKPKPSKAEVAQVRNLITRNGQNTVTAGGQEADLEAFRAENPNIAPETLKPELLRRRADLSFHVFPQHGGFIKRTAGTLALHAPMAAIGAFSHNPGLAAATAAGTLMLQNARPIAGRVLYRPALELQRLQPPRLIATGLGYAAARQEEEAR